MPESQLSTLFAVFALLVTVICAGVVIMVILYQRRVMRQQMHIQLIEATHQQALFESSVESQENERERIAKDLHDEIGASLSAIKLNLSLARRLRKDEAQLETSAEEDSLRLIDRTIQRVREISHTLMPPALQGLGLKAALGDFLGTIPDGQGWKTTLQVNGQVRRLPEKTELAAYRIVQESVHNALRHAGPSHLRVHLDFGPSSLHLTVADDGKGFDPDALGERGLGLRSMESRARLIGGTFDLESKPGVGTTLKVLFPDV
jgi:signal transduction histidine kinase